MCLEVVSQGSGSELKWCETPACTKMSSKTSSNQWKFRKRWEKVNKQLRGLSVGCQKVQNFFTPLPPTARRKHICFLLLLFHCLHCDIVMVLPSLVVLHIHALQSLWRASPSGLKASQSGVSLYCIGISQIPTSTTVWCFCQMNTTVLVALWKLCM